VILSPVQNTQAACVFLYHLAGARDDPLDLKGGSLILSKLMPVAATKNLDRLERIYSVIINGGSFNFFLNYDYAHSSSIIPENLIQNTLWFESERINSLKLSTQTIKSNIRRIQLAITGLKKSNLTFRSFSWMKSQIFLNTVYSTPLFGDLSNLKNYTPDRIKKLYLNFSNPEKILLIICGKINIADVKKHINRYFGDIKQHTKQTKTVYKIIKPNKKFLHKNLLLDNIPHHSILIGFRTPSRLSYDYIPFKLVQYYLLDKRTSKLEDILLNKNQLKVNIGYEITNNIESNALIIEISTSTRTNFEKVRYILKQEFLSLGKIPIPNSKIKLIKSIMKLDFYKKLSDLEDRSKIIAQNYHLYKDLKFEERFLTKLERITPIDTTKIGKKYFLKNNQVILNVYRKK
jgi:predicted Zn-dependent peptidase